jgi:hypothetical protein
MPTRNYGQARRSRELARKKRQQEKMLRKQERAQVPEAPQDPAPTEVVPAPEAIERIT